MNKQRQAAITAIDGSALGRAYQVVSGQERQHNVPEGTYGSLAVLDQRNALMVLVTEPNIRKFLQENDPKALQQAETALVGEGYSR
jgi:hypothetical protein